MDPNPVLKSKIFENFDRILLELHYFLYILPFFTQNFYFLICCRQPKTVLYVISWNSKKITNPRSNLSFRHFCRTESRILDRKLRILKIEFQLKKMPGLRIGNLVFLKALVETNTQKQKSGRGQKKNPGSPCKHPCSQCSHLLSRIHLP